jgi:hypothetical protein
MIFLYKEMALIMCLNFLFHAEGFKIPFPMDFLSSFDSFHQLKNDYLNNAIPSSVVDFTSFYGIIKDATVTKRVDNALAGIIAESAAGATGALITRTNKGRKKDSLETIIKNTGAVFGARFAAEGKSKIFNSSDDSKHNSLILLWHFFWKFILIHSFQAFLVSSAFQGHSLCSWLPL